MTFIINANNNLKIIRYDYVSQLKKSRKIKHEYNKNSLQIKKFKQEMKYDRTNNVIQKHTCSKLKILM